MTNRSAPRTRNLLWLGRVLVASGRVPVASGRVLVATGVVLMAVACGLGSSEEDDRAALIAGLVDSGTATETDATCIVDGALEEFTIEELASLNEPDADPALQDVMVRKATACLVEGDGLDNIVKDVAADSAENSDEGAADGESDAPTITSEVVPVAESSGDEASPESDPAFCAASAEYWITSNAGSHIDLSHPGQVRAVFEQMEVRLDEAIALAPNDELAQPALLARDHFDALHFDLAAFQYDYRTFESSHVFVTLESRIEALGEIDDLLETYLAGPCGYESAALQGGAEARAVEITATVAGEPVIDGPDTTDGYMEIADSTDRLKVDVPDHWEDVQSEPSAAGSSLTIAPDVSAYLTSWAADGMKMTVKTVSRPVDWRQPMYETNASSDCTIVSSEPYSDALYTGWIDEYRDCGGSSTAVVIGATDAEFSVEILVEVQFDDVDTGNDVATLKQIIDTFKAR